ncbi:hypothetical protein Bbelb_090830 [Branchiostoma belcheri]|nr:hypothetical protein Bbelb_090830 [Branchiostoma belcheri]
MGVVSVLESSRSTSLGVANYGVLDENRRHVPPRRGRAPKTVQLQPKQIPSGRTPRHVRVGGKPRTDGVRSTTVYIWQRGANWKGQTSFVILPLTELIRLPSHDHDLTSPHKAVEARG